MGEGRGEMDSNQGDFKPQYHCHSTKGREESRGELAEGRGGGERGTVERGEGRGREGRGEGSKVYNEGIT